MQKDGKIVSDPMIELIQWIGGKEGTGPWCQHAVACVNAPDDFWNNVKNLKLNMNMSLRGLADVASVIFSVLPNAADSESLFSELERIIT